MSDPRSHGPATLPRAALVLAVCCTAFLVARGLVREDPYVLDGPPAELIGEWVSVDPRYQDRGFEVRLDEFHLRVAADDVRAYPLRSVRGEPLDGGVTRYELEYLTPDGVSIHRFTIDASGVGRLDRPSDVAWSRRQR